MSRIGRFTFSATLWLHPAGDWRFVTVPADISEDITELTPVRGGFGSVRVAVTVGRTAWRTSVFPDKASGCYLLPMKKAVRTAEGLSDGDEVTVTVDLADL